MTAESIRIERDALLTRIVASTASATRALKTMIRDLRRSQWFLLVAVVGGAVIALVAIKLMALLAAAFDISFLRDVGNNGTPWATVGGIGAGISHFFSGGYPPNLPPNLAGPGQYGPYGNPWSGTDSQGIPYSGRYIGTRNDGTVGPVTPSHFTDPATGQNYVNSAGAMVWFSQWVQAAASTIIGPDGKSSSGNAGGKA